MTDYLSRPGFDFSSPQMAVDYDQNPAWSPYFGELIFANVPLRENLQVLDIACGTGYPALELSQRMGPSCQISGIDIWEAGLERARHKVEAFNIENVALLRMDAAAMDFPDRTFDLIVSNVGINNFESPLTVFRECYRVGKPGAVVAMTTNPTGHMAEFYEFFRETLAALNLQQYLGALEDHIAHRHSVAWVCRELETAGFSVRRVLENSFRWRFLNGTAFLNTFHIVYGFLPGWKTLLPDDLHVRVFSEIEARINSFAATAGEFRVTVPVRYIEAEKPGP